MSQVFAQPLPWQREQWQRIGDQHARGQLPHALLIAGPPAVGKRAFARALAQRLLCAAPDAGVACGQCRSCGLLAAQSHPDLFRLAPEEAGKAIKIDQVRQVVAALTQTAQQGGLKIAVIEPAEAMNRNAANALLKTLEEPGGATLLMLVSDAPGRLLPTLRSRCHRLEFPVPPLAATRAWLALRSDDGARLDLALAEADGRPLLASELLDGEGIATRRELAQEFAAVLQSRASAIQLAERWQQRDWPELLSWLQGRLAQALRVRMGQAAHADAAVAELARARPPALFALVDNVNALLAQTQAGGNPNRQLALETLLFGACDAVNGKSLLATLGG